MTVHSALVVYRSQIVALIEPPSITGLHHDLNNYLTYYDHQRPHHGK